MKPLTQAQHQDFTARMREAADYIAKRIKGRMQPFIRYTPRQPKRPTSEETK